MSTFFRMRFNNNSFPSIALAIIPKVLPAVPAVLDGIDAVKPIVKVGMKKAGGLMALMDIGEEE